MGERGPVEMERRGRKVTYILVREAREERKEGELVLEKAEQ